MNDEEYRMLRGVLERELGISTDLPHRDVMRMLDVRDRKEADRKWQAGKCDLCIGCEFDYTCPHRRGDFPEGWPESKLLNSMDKDYQLWKD